MGRASARNSPSSRIWLVAGASAGGVDQDQVDRAETLDRGGHRAGVVGDGERNVDDLRISAQLLDRGDPIRVDRHQADAQPLRELEAGGELGHGRGLADARGADQRDDPSAARHRGDWGRDREARFDGRERREPDRLGVAQILGFQPIGDRGDQPTGVILGDVGLQEVGIGRDQVGGNVG